MKLDQFISHLLSRLMGRMLRRLAAMAVFTLFALVALYNLTIAGLLALDSMYGPLYARLIVVGAYAVLALVVFIYLFATRAKTPPARPRTQRSQQDLRIAELLESLLLGYTATRRKSRHS